jgi:hypothetical protein
MAAVLAATASPCAIVAVVGCCEEDGTGGMPVNADIQLENMLVPPDDATCDDGGGA